jgi:hypothetical protein
MDDRFFRNDLFNLFLWHLEIAGKEAAGKKNFEDAYRKALNFEKESDWRKFRACIDLFEDTEYAIISAFKFQLGYIGNKNFDFGEKNIRLHGILNAIYLQIYSIIELSKLLYYSNSKVIKKDFSKLPIYKLRGIAASHTVNFELDPELLKDKKINKITSFRIVQVHLTKTGERIEAIDENNISLRFNLLNELKCYVSLSSDYIMKIMNHSIENLVKNEEDRIEFIKRRDEILLKMVDYTELNENGKYFKRIENRLMKLKK